MSTAPRHSSSSQLRPSIASRLLGRNAGRRRRVAQPWPARVEGLEERVLLASRFVDLGPLWIGADSFQQSGTHYTASGTIEIGYAPAGSEAFLPLLEVEGAVAFTTEVTDPVLEVTNALIEAVPGGSSSQVPLVQVTGTANLEVGQLVGAGVALGAAGMQAKGVPVDGASLTPSTLALANPGGGATDDAEVRLEGALGFIPLVGLSLPISGADYVAIDVAGTTLTDLSLPVTSTFSLYGVSFAPSSLTASFATSQGLFTFEGGTTIATADGGLAGVPASLDLELSEGVVTEARVSNLGQFELFDLQTTPGDGFTFLAQGERFVAYGDVTLTIPGSTVGGSVEPVAATLGSFDSPGYVIGGDGKVQSLGMTINGNFAFYGLLYEAQNVTVTYNGATDQYDLSGSVEVPILFDAEATLGTAQQPGIVIKDGDFHLDAFQIQLTDVTLGAFIIDNFLVAYSSNAGNVDLKVTLDLWFPGGWKVGGGIDILNGELNGLSFDFQAGGDNPGIEIYDTGLSVIGLSGSVDNLEHPEQLIVSGGLTLIWGDQFQFPDVGNVTPLKVIGTFTVDRSELIADIQAYVGAYTATDGKTVGAIGSGDGKVTLDWGQQDYAIDLSGTFYGGIFGFDADIDITRDALSVLGDVKLEIPGWVPFVGGHSIASADFALYVDYHDATQSFIAAWVDVDLFITSFEIGVKYVFDGTPSIIGSHQINAIKQGAENPAPATYTYFASFAVPPGATHGTFQVNWGFPWGVQSIAILPPNASTPIDQSQFSASNGLALDASLSSASTAAVKVVGSSTDDDTPLPAGEYQVALTSNVRYGTSPTFTGTFGFPSPSVLKPAPSGTGGSPTVPIVFTVDDDFQPTTRVSLYVDSDTSGYDGSPVPGASNLTLQNATYDSSTKRWTLPVTWNQAGLLPLSQYLYAVVNDGTNSPVYSAYSDPVTPEPPLSGTVSDSEHGFQGLSGITVFLDLNHNGQFDPATDPFDITGDTGFYSFFNLTAGTTYDVTVLVTPGFLLDTSLPNPAIRTYVGQPITANFNLKKLAAIQGTIFQDLDQDGKQDPGDPGLPGWQAFLDTDADGVRDQGEITAQTGSDGSYTFYNLQPGTTYTVGVVLQTGFFQTAPTPIPPGTSTATIDGKYQQVTGRNFGVLQYSTISGTINGYPIQNGQLSPNTQPLAGWTVQAISQSLIDAGGPAAGLYQADLGPGNGQLAPTSGNAIDTSRVTDPAPQAVYQTNRYGQHLSYSVGGLVPGLSYTVRLHFAETYWTTANSRLFNVAVNGVAVLALYDIFARAGGANVAVVETATATADASGTILIEFAALRDNAQINGIEIEGVASSTTTDASGNYTLGGLHPGNYVVREVVPAGWREIAPFRSDFQMGPAAFIPNGNPAVPADSIATGDFDGDGHQDYATPWQVQNNQLTGVNIFFGNGDGTFDPQFVSVLSGYANLYQAVGFDFYGNGRPVIGLIFEDGNVQLIEQQNPQPGNRQFVAGATPFDLQLGPQSDNPSTLSFQSRVVVGDFDNDGRDDLAVALYEYVSLFAVEASILAVMRPYARGLPNQPNGPETDLTKYYESVTGTSNPAPLGIAPGDFNGDGNLDLIVGGGSTHKSGTFTVAFGDGGGFFNRPVTTIPGTTGFLGIPGVGDIDGDGRPDAAIIATQNGSGVQILLDDPVNGLSATGTVISVPNAGAQRVFLQDINGDLKPDLVVLPLLGNYWYAYLNQGTAPYFQSGQAIPLGYTPQPYDLALVDLTGDGLLDMLAPDNNTNGTYIFLNRSVVNRTGYALSLAPAQNSSGNNFVNAQLGQINGRVAEDLDRDGRLAPAEPGRAGVTVYIDLNRNGQLDSGEPSTVTGPRGAYAFNGLPVGTYLVRVVAEPGRRLTTPMGGAHEVVVGDPGATSAPRDFGTAVSLNAVLNVPASSSGVLTLLRNGSRVEVIDRDAGVLASWPLADLDSVTIQSSAAGATRLLVDLASGGRFATLGGITFVGSTGDRDALELLLGPAPDLVRIVEASATVDSGPTVRWVQTESVRVSAGAGADTMTVVGRLASGTEVELDGGPGNDTYVLAMRRSRLTITDPEGDDTLDFRDAGAGVRIDLAASRGGAQAIDRLGNVLALRGVLENITGSAYDDVLLGNASANRLEGAGGADVLLGGAGTDLLLGGPGPDSLVGGQGRDVLIGGQGRDTLLGGPGEDLLVGPPTVYVDNRTALQMLQGLWTSSQPYPDRVARLTDDGLDVFLDDSTVLEDLARDLLAGGPGRDWFVGLTDDRVVSPGRNEVVTIINPAPPTTTVETSSAEPSSTRTPVSRRAVLLARRRALAARRQFARIAAREALLRRRAQRVAALLASARLRIQSAAARR